MLSVWQQVAPLCLHASRRSIGHTLHASLNKNYRAMLILPSHSHLTYQYDQPSKRSSPSPLRPPTVPDSASDQKQLAHSNPASSTGAAVNLQKNQATVTQNLHDQNLHDYASPSLLLSTTPTPIRSPTSNPPVHSPKAAPVHSPEATPSDTNRHNKYPTRSMQHASSHHHPSLHASSINARATLPHPQSIGERRRRDSRNQTKIEASLTALHTSYPS